MKLKLIMLLVAVQVLAAGNASAAPFEGRLFTTPACAV